MIGTSATLSLVITTNGSPRKLRSRGGQAKHLARIAAEYTQLLYHAEKAKEEKCAFVDEVQWVSTL